MEKNKKKRRRARRHDNGHDDDSRATNINQREKRRDGNGLIGRHERAEGAHKYTRTVCIDSTPHARRARQHRHARHTSRFIFPFGFFVASPPYNTSAPHKSTRAYNFFFYPFSICGVIDTWLFFLLLRKKKKKDAKATQVLDGRDVNARAGGSSIARERSHTLSHDYCLANAAPCIGHTRRDMRLRHNTAGTTHTRRLALTTSHTRTAMIVTITHCWRAAVSSTTPCRKYPHSAQHAISFCDIYRPLFHCARRMFIYCPFALESSSSSTKSVVFALRCSFKTRVGRRARSATTELH